MAQILKIEKKVRKVRGSGRVVVQSIQLKKYTGKNVIVTVTTKN